MKKVTNTQINTRQVFIDTFCTLYKTKRIEKITIKELTDQAGYNRSTFYKYFDDIYALLTSIEDELIVKFKEIIIMNIKSTVDEISFSSFITIQEENPKILHALLANPNNLRSIERLKMEMNLIFIEQLNISKTDAKANYILEFYISGVISVVRRWLINEKDISFEELAELIRTILSELMLPQINKHSLLP